MTNKEAKETLNAMYGLMGLALIKPIADEIEEDNKPMTTIMSRFKEAVQIASDVLDIADDKEFEIEKKDDGDKK